MLSPEVQTAMERSVLCWLATVSDAGQPNVSPKEIFAPFDAEHMVIANIASPTSVRNLLSNPSVCVSFVDIFVQKGFKIVGTAQNISRHAANYAHWVHPLQSQIASAMRSYGVQPAP